MIRFLKSLFRTRYIAVRSGKVVDCSINNEIHTKLAAELRDERRSPSAREAYFKSLEVYE